MTPAVHELPRMGRRAAGALAMLLAVAALPVRAQVINLQIVLPTAANMPRSITAWEANPAVVQVRMTNLGPADLQGLRFTFAIRGPQGEIARSRPGQEPTVAVGRAQTRAFLLDEVVRLSAVDYQSGLERQIVRDGIPEGAYTICALVLGPSGQSLSGPERCFAFRVNDPDPPSLVRPLAPEEVVPGQLRFQWTPVRMQPVSYRLTVKPLFAGQSVTAAMGANPVLFEQEVNSTFYQYLPSDPDFSMIAGATGFVWQVRSVSDGRPVGRNAGLSPVGSFKLRSLIATADTTASGDAAPVEAPACGVGATSPKAPASQQPGTFAAASLAGKKVRLGFFMLDIIEASGSPAALTGSGTVQVPFLQRAVPVRFEGLGVNAGLEAYAGRATGTEQESARLAVDWMNSTALLSGITFAPDNATIDASLTYDLAVLNQTLGFAGRALRITPNGLQSGSGRLGLAADLNAQFGGEAVLRVKGSSSATEGSYVQWGCAGFERAQVVLEQEFPRSWFVPVDAAGKDRGGNTLLRFTSVITAAEQGAMATGTMDRAMLAFAPGFIIEPSPAVLDLSSTANPATMAFPASYQGVAGAAWTGVFIENFTLSLPEALRSFGRTEPVKVSGRNIVIDRTGVSVDAALQNVITFPNGDLGGWGFSIDEFRLSVVSSSLTQGSLLGKVLLPIAGTALDYTATISVPDEEARAQAATASRTGQSSVGLKYEFQIKPATDLDATLWGRAKMTLAPTSRVAVAMQKVNDKWTAQPVMDLNGSISITQDVDLVGMRFEGFKILPTSPYIQKGTWSLASPQHFLGAGPGADAGHGSPGGADGADGAGGADGGTSTGSASAAPGKVGGLPITVTNVEVIGRLESGAITAGLRFTAGVNLPGARTLFSASTTIQVLGKIDRPANGPMRPRFDRVVVDQICASGGIRNVVELSRGSCLNFFRDDPVFGTGAAGTIGASILKTVSLSSTVRFGNVRSVEYFYVDGSVVLRNGVPFPGINAVGLYGFNGGVYYHMTKGGSATRVTYTPSASIALGIKAGVTLGTYPRPEAMNGDVTLEGAFTTSGGLDYLSLRGTGFMMSPVVNRPANPPVRMTMDLTYSFRTSALDGTFQVNINQAGIMTGNGSARLHADASKFFLHAGVGGSPTRPLITEGSKFIVRFGPVLTGRAYFATGTAGTLPPFPALPPGAAQPSGASRNTAISRATAGGVMVGASLSLAFTADGGFAGATVNGQAGFDVALQDYGNRRCFNEVVGMNGWYANGQFYAWIEAAGWVGMSESVTEWINTGFAWITDVGCEIASWFGGCSKKKVAQYKQVVRLKPVRYDIMKARAAATFEAGLPKPTWYAGKVEVKYKALGAIKGSTSINFTEGRRCAL